MVVISSLHPLKAGKEKWAAFLETRRYADYIGSTTEFSKWEASTAPHLSSFLLGLRTIKLGGGLQLSKLNCIWGGGRGGEAAAATKQTE